MWRQRGPLHFNLCDVVTELRGLALTQFLSETKGKPTQVCYPRLDRNIKIKF